MGEAHNTYPNLNYQQQFRLKKINDVKDYFIAEIKERELTSKKLVLINLYLFHLEQMVALLLHHLKLLLQHV